MCLREFLSPQKSVNPEVICFSDIKLLSAPETIKHAYDVYGDEIPDQPMCIINISVNARAQCLSYLSNSRVCSLVINNAALH